MRISKTTVAGSVITFSNETEQLPYVGPAKTNRGLAGKLANRHR